MDVLLLQNLDRMQNPCFSRTQTTMQQNNRLKLAKLAAKSIQHMAQYSRVNSCMDLDNNSHKIDERQRVNSILNRLEVSVRRILTHGERVRGEELVLGCFKCRVPKAPNKPHPLHELLFCELGLRHIGRQPLPGGVPGSYSFGVAERWGWIEKKKKNNNTENTLKLRHGERKRNKEDSA